MKYAIDIGHNAPPDTGAMGGFEDELNKALAEQVAAGLVSLGNDVVMVNPGKVFTVRQSLQARCRNANVANVDRFVSFHFNAFNGVAKGTEVFYVSKNGYKMALPVVNEICNLNSGHGEKFVKRGAKRSSHYYVLNETDAPAILIETCFCDNPDDMNIYYSLGVNAVASAIVKGLTGKSPDLADQPCLYIN